MSNIVKRLALKSGRYRSEVYPNPALAFHYAQLQALAFDEDFDPRSQAAQGLDRTIPKWKGIHRAAGEFMAEWNREILDDERAVAVPKKGAGTKRAEAPQPDEGDITATVEMWRDGKIDKVRCRVAAVWRGLTAQIKVADLRSYAKFNDISLQGISKKMDLLDLLAEHLEKAAKEGVKKPKKEKK